MNKYIKILNEAHNLKKEIEAIMVFYLLGKKYLKEDILEEKVYYNSCRYAHTLTSKYWVWVHTKFKKDRFSTGAWFIFSSHYPTYLINFEKERIENMVWKHHIKELLKVLESGVIVSQEFIEKRYSIPKCALEIIVGKEI